MAAAPKAAFVKTCTPNHLFRGSSKALPGKSPTWPHLLSRKCFAGAARGVGGCSGVHRGHVLCLWGVGWDRIMSFPWHMVSHSRKVPSSV